MSSNKFGLKFAAIRFDSAGAFLPGGLTRDELVAQMPRLEAARREVIGEVEQLRASAAAVTERLPGAAEIVDLPERMLGDYRARRGKSELGRILGTAKRLREMVDRVVIVGSEADCSAARALFEAGCHPYHNEQGRGDRGGRPRIYFAPSDFDNDALQGLLDLLPQERKPATVDDRWGIIVIDSNGASRTSGKENKENTEVAEPKEAVAALRVLLAALWRSCGANDEAAARLVVPVVGKSCAAAGAIRSLSCSEIFELPAEAGGAGAVFTSAGLLPASVMGLDIVRLLEGVIAMNERFRTSPIGDNPALDFAGVCQLMRRAKGATAERFVAWGKGLAALVMWYERLRETGIASLESQISDFKSEIPDLRINLIVESVRRDRIVIGATDHDDDRLKHLARKTLPEVKAAAIEAAKTADAANRRPAVDIRLPALDESSLGQLFQMLILAGGVEDKWSARGDRGSGI